MPKSWYPDDTPDNLEKWQVPSCRKCNWAHGRNEEELFLKLALHFDPGEGPFQKIAQKVFRSMSPEHANSKRDREKRRKQKRRLFKELGQTQNLDFSKANILPGFGYNPNFPIHQQPPLSISEKKLKKFGEKVTRGVYYLLNDSCIGPDYTMDIFVPAENVPLDVRQTVRKYGKESECGPGIHVVLAISPDDNKSAIMELTIWNRLKFFSIITPT